MAFNTTSLSYDLPTNVTGFADVGTYLNGITEGYFGLLLIFSLWMILAISFRDQNIKVNMLASSFVCLVLSMLMWTLGWLNFVVVILFGLAVAAVLVFGRDDR